MQDRARLILKSDPRTVYPLEADRVSIGRGSDCDIRITDPYLSRRQAELERCPGGFAIRNVGGNPIRVNDVEVERCVLQHSDRITLGRTELIFALEQPRQERLFEEMFEGVDIDDPTVFMASPSDIDSGPRIVVTMPGGANRSYPLVARETRVGRAADADIRLDDPSVSREHGIIVDRRDGFFFVNKSRTNPASINDQPLREVRMVSGDQIRVGAYLLSFFSDRPEDLRSTEFLSAPENKRFWTVAWGAIILLALVLAAYVGYSRYYEPWKLRKALEAISRQADSGSVQSAHRALLDFMLKPAPADVSRDARALLAETTLVMAEEIRSKQGPEQSRQFLSSYLKEHGAEKESGPVWDQLNSDRMRLAQQLEENGDYPGAIREYAAIWDDSPIYEDAQKAIRRLWLEYQERNLQEQRDVSEAPQESAEVRKDGADANRAMVARWMEQAEQHFLAKHYLVPINENAFILYQKILSLDPENTVALQRVQQMLDFYRENAEKHIAAEQYSRAASYLRRYLLIDPENSSVRERLAWCRTRQADASNDASAGPKRRPGSESARNQALQQQKVKQLLDESGTDSSWVMRYLFGKEDQDVDSGTPWKP